MIQTTIPTPRHRLPLLLRKHAIATVSFVAASFAAHGAFAELLVYEPFDYPVGAEIHGQSGGIGFGDNEWEDNQEGSSAEMDHIADGSLSFANPLPLLTTGNSLSQNSISVNGSTDIRSFTIIPGIDGTTTWMSFLMRFEGTLSEDTVAHFGVRPNSSGPAPFFGVFNNAANEIVFGIGSNSAGTVFSDISFTPGQTYLLVASITWNTAVGASELVNFYVNPTLQALPPASPDVFRDDLNIATAGGTNRLSSLELASGGDGVEWRFDELRIGNTWSDVTPVVPESSTTAMAVGCLLLAVGLKRAFSHGRRRA